MERLYKIFDLEPVYFDDQKSVKELLEYALDRSDYYEPAGTDILTVYDASKYHVVTDTSIACCEAFSPKDSLGHGRNGLCLAYYLPNCFFYAEGGWGHHMKEMNLAKKIPDPVAISFQFNDFKNTVVVNGNLSIEQIYDYLTKTTYLEKPQTTFNFYDMEYGLPKPGTKRTFQALTEDGKTKIKKACDKFIEPICRIPSR